VLFFEVLFIYRYKELFFDPIPFLQPAQMDVALPLICWMLTIICLLIGYKTRYAAIINYVFTLVFMSTLTSFEYHMHYAYAGINFLLIFLPISNLLSLDSLKNPHIRKSASSVYYFLPVFIGVALVYFDSIFFKLSSQFWTKGMGMWLPASLPQASTFKFQWLLDSELLSRAFGYFTFFFEFIFLFTFWFKKFRIPLLISGIVLHFGILVTFSIPLFAWGVIAFYFLLVPISFWNNCLAFLGKSITTVEWRHGKHLAAKEKKYLGVFIVIVVVFQLNITINYSLTLKPFSDKIHNNLPMATQLRRVEKGLRTVSRKMLGITSHGVFMDGHFNEYNHLIAVTYQNNEGEGWLPIIDKNGEMGAYLSGANWVNWTFRVNSPKIKMKRLENGIIRYTAFWAKKNNISLSNTTFKILVKKTDLPKNMDWEPGFLKRQRNKPWQEAGTFSWVNGKPNFNLQDIERM
tara:strand:+ start:18494 stop:19876 length:1383 start_codon:yes stop_codon:yes gene_type:complete